MTFSFIVPVYNTEKYLAKCLDSLLNQTINDFEIIIVNDGSTDNSQLIIDKYQEKYPDLIKSYKKTNSGLSDARNYGVEKSQGKFIIFVDSDDYIDNNLLKTINDIIITNSKIDVISYNAQIIYPNNKMGTVIKKPPFDILNGEESLKTFIKNKQTFEPACFYAFNANFWEQNDFKFAKGKYNEDFGLIPEIIIKAKAICSLDYIGYYYYQSEKSIMRNVDNNIQKAFDMWYHFNILKNISDKFLNDSYTKMLFDSYLANAVINQIKNLDKQNRNEYISKLKEADVFNLLLEDNLLKKFKKRYLKLKYKV